MKRFGLRRAGRWLRAGLGLLAASAALAALPAAAAEPTVIVLSWDGVRHDYPDRGRFPALARMAREGARAERLVPPFPSNTFPGHVTLATGTHPDRHGILNNRFRDPSRGRYDYSDDASWIEAEPLWIAAERQGVRSAVFFWVGSASDWHGARASYRKEFFDSSVPEREKVDQLVAWLDLPEARRPRLLMAWWHGADHAGHTRGPAHPDVAEELAQQDAELSRLLAALDARRLWPSTTLLVVSDHGMSAARRHLDIHESLARAGVEADVETGGGMAWVYLRDPQQLEAAERATRELPRVAVYRRDAIPERLRARHPTRSGDLLLLAEPPGRFAARGPWWKNLTRWLGYESGTHGYDPEHPDMGAIFLALGRGVPAGARLEAVHAVDVAPTVAALLGIEPPRDAEGVARLPLEQP